MQPWVTSPSGRSPNPATVLALWLARFLGRGIELRYYWDLELRQSQVYRNGEELAAAANLKREELIANGWTEAPKLAWGN
jgi:hypothetical protein